MRQTIISLCHNRHSNINHHPIMDNYSNLQNDNRPRTYNHHPTNHNSHHGMDNSNNHPIVLMENYNNNHNYSNNHPHHGMDNSNNHLSE